MAAGGPPPEDPPRLPGGESERHVPGRPRPPRRSPIPTLEEIEAMIDGIEDPATRELMRAYWHGWLRLMRALYAMAPGAWGASPPAPPLPPLPPGLDAATRADLEKRIAGLGSGPPALPPSPPEPPP